MSEFLHVVDIITSVIGLVLMIFFYRIYSKANDNVDTHGMVNAGIMMLLMAIVALT